MKNTSFPATKQQIADGKLGRVQPGSKAGTFALSLLLLLTLTLMGLPSGWSATINLANPVSDSLTVDGVNWKFDSVSAGTTPDSSTSGYTGTLDALTGSLPTLTTGVDLAGTSGYDDGLNFVSGPGVGNPRVINNMGVSNNLAMVATDFTGGAWIKFASIDTGVSQRILIMDRGGFNTTAGAGTGHYTFLLDKDTSNNWRLGFQTGDGSSLAFGGTAYTAWDLQDGEWHHLGYNFDYNAVGDNEVTLWLDGSDVGSFDISVNITSGATDSTTRRFSVGERATSSYYTHFNGALDDVFVTTGLHDFQAVPEPGAITLMVVGGALLMMRSRRRS